MQGPRDSSLSVRLFHGLTLAFLLVALVFGGASRAEVVSSDIVALAALPLLAFSIWRLRLGLTQAWRGPLILLACLVALPLVQLIPLPPGLWTALPGRAPVVEGLRAAGLEPGWAPISLSPQRTWSSLLSLLPACAMFLAALTLDTTMRMRLVFAVLVVAALNVLLGAAQLAGGEDSALRLYAVTNKSAAVGLFSNRNHLASMLIVAATLAAAWATRASVRRPAPKLALGGALLLIGLIIVGVGMTGSRAGLLLLFPAGVGALALAWRAGVGQGRGKAILGLLIAGFLGAVVVVKLSFGEAIDRLQTGFAGSNFSEELRVTGAGVAWEAIKAFAPVGAGFGTFVPVYKMFEPTETVINTYMNHVHDDWIEVVLEGGLPAIALLVAFLVWFGRTGWSLWRTDGAELTLARAGSLCILLMLAHSAMDYPLRTPVMMCLFALSCALMIKAPDARAPLRVVART